MATSTALQVLDRTTGEVIDVTLAPTERLAEFCTNLADHRAELAQAEAIVNAELVARLDRDALWTQSVDDGARIWEITAPSSADKVDYLPDTLDETLAGLVDDGAISQTAAAAAMKRQVTVELLVPYGVPLDALAAALKNAETVTVVDQEVKVGAVAAALKPVKNGIGKLLKVPAAKPAIEAVQVTTPAGLRKAKVTEKKK